MFALEISSHTEEIQGLVEGSAGKPKAMQSPNMLRRFS